MKAPVFVPNVERPSCGRQSPIDYIQKDTEYRWWCGNGECGRQYRFIWRSSDGLIESEPTGVVLLPATMLIKLPPQAEDVFVAVDCTRDARETMDQTKHQNAFRIDENSCPSNLFYNGREVWIGGESDPHGLFRHVDTVDRVKREGIDDVLLEDFSIDEDGEGK